MAKKTIKDPGSAIVVLDRSREINFKMWEMKLFKERTGKSILKMDFAKGADSEFMSEELLTELCYVSLVRDDPELQIEDFEKMISFGQMMEMLPVITSFLEADGAGGGSAKPRDFQKKSERD